MYVVFTVPITTTSTASYIENYANKKMLHQTILLTSL